MKKAFLIAGAAVLLGGASVGGYLQASSYIAERDELRKADENIRTAIAKASVSADNVLGSEGNDNSAITYAEVFERVEQTNKDIDAGIVSLKISKLDAGFKSAGTEYLNALQTTLRFLSAKDRKSLELRAKLENATTLDTEYYSTPYNEYTNDLEYARLKEAKASAREAVEEHEAATSSFATAAQKLSDVIKKRGPALGEIELVRQSTLNEAIKANAPMS